MQMIRNYIFPVNAHVFTSDKFRYKLYTIILRHYQRIIARHVWLSNYICIYHNIMYGIQYHTYVHILRISVYYMFIYMLFKFFNIITLSNVLSRISIFVCKVWRVECASCRCVKGSCSALHFSSVCTSTREVCANIVSGIYRAKSKWFTDTIVRLHQSFYYKCSTFLAMEARRT